MNLALNWLREIRASNLVFIAIAPVIIWLIASSRNYGPALKAVLGIEPQPWVRRELGWEARRTGRADRAENALGESRG